MRVAGLRDPASPPLCPAGMLAGDETTICHDGTYGRPNTFPSPLFSAVAETPTATPGAAAAAPYRLPSERSPSGVSHRGEPRLRLNVRGHPKRTFRAPAITLPASDGHPLQLAGKRHPPQRVPPCLPPQAPAPSRRCGKEASASDYHHCAHQWRSKATLARCQCRPGRCMCTVGVGSA